MDPFLPPDAPQGGEPDRRARRKKSDPPTPPSAPSSRYRRPSSSRPKKVSLIEPALSAAPEAEIATERLASLATEIAGLVEAAMRSLSLGRAGLLSAPALAELTGGVGIAKQMDEAVASLERIAALVHEAMRPCAQSDSAAPVGGKTLFEALEHAADCLRPSAAERGVKIELSVDDSLRGAPAGALYSVALHGLRNAVEASGPGGVVRMSAAISPLPGGGAEARVEIVDEGVGPPIEDARRVFEHGFTTKPGREGLGLALSHNILSEMGGAIELTARMDGARRRGSELRFRCPVPRTH